MAGTGTGPAGCDSQYGGIDAGTLVRLSSRIPSLLMLGVGPYLASSVVNTTLSWAGKSGEMRRIGRGSSAEASFRAKYKVVLDAKGINIDIDANLKASRTMSAMQLYDAFKTGGKWDYKNDAAVKAAVGKNSNLAQEFGNFHFGLIAASRGLGLYFATLGAGAYQVFKQGGGSAAALHSAVLGSDLESHAFSGLALVFPKVGKYTHAALQLTGSNSRARQVIHNSCNAMGDNPGDALDIMRGWNFFFLRQGYAPPS